MSLTELILLTEHYLERGCGQTREGKRLNQEELVARHALVSTLWALDRIEDI